MKPSLQELLDRAMRDVGLTPRRVNLAAPSDSAGKARRAHALHAPKKNGKANSSHGR